MKQKIMPRGGNIKILNRDIYEKELSEKIIGYAFEVYNHLSNGFLEKVYERALQKELASRGLQNDSQLPLNVMYKGESVGDFYADIIVENKIILELKHCTNIEDIHITQFINYLKATSFKLGYIINFGNDKKLQFKRIIY